MSEQNTAPVKLGVENIKEVMLLGFGFGKMLKTAKENDGEINLSDAPLLVMIVPTLGPAIDEIDQVIPEFKDMDAEEAKYLMEEAKKELGDTLSDEELIEKIVAGLEWGVATVKLIRAVA